jgi:hypothetical protein
LRPATFGATGAVLETAFFDAGGNAFTSGVASGCGHAFRASASDFGPSEVVRVSPAALDTGALDFNLPAA